MFGVLCAFCVFDVAKSHHRPYYSVTVPYPDVPGVGTGVLRSVQERVPPRRMP
jgi:hypothetical protein